MGHRAAVAYVDDDGRVAAHYSHWGALEAKLAFGPHRIKKDQLLGGGEATPAFAKALFNGLEEMAGDDTTTTAPGNVEGTPVDPETRDTYESLAAWAEEYVDFLHHEAAYVVDTREDPLEVRAFDTAWHAGEESLEGPNTGILVELEEADEWNKFTAPRDISEIESVEEFVAAMADYLGDNTSRVPEFSPYPIDPEEVTDEIIQLNSV